LVKQRRKQAEGRWRSRLETAMPLMVALQRLQDVARLRCFQVALVESR
jgi:hypothetical protein